MSILLVNGNSLSVPLADESVHCVVTSPPYWGLRDYGTATWQGGNAECDHKPVSDNSQQAATSTLGGSKRNVGNALSGFKDTCRKCGAIRIDNQLGLECTPEEYVANMVAVFREVWRVLRKDGTCWVNLGDSYAGGGGFSPDAPSSVTSKSGKYGLQGALIKGRACEGYSLKPKDLCGIPWRVAFALQADGWYLRSDIIWSKPNPMPESVTDRPTKAHEYLFLLAKAQKYYYDADAVREEHKEPWRSGEHRTFVVEDKNDDKEYVHPGFGRGKYSQAIYNPAGRNRRTVWEIATQPYSGAHFATFPEKLVEPCIKAGTSERGVCPVCGAGWRRVSEKGFTSHEAETETQYQEGAAANRLALLRQAARKNGGEYVNDKRTTGWQPACSHDADPIPAIIFDPFAGSGTTLVVARKLGRHGVGLDLSRKYLAENARARLELDKWDAWVKP